MPIYQRAITLTSQDLKELPLEECEEVLLALRYMSFRESDEQVKLDFLERINMVLARIEAINASKRYI